MEAPEAGLLSRPDENEHSTSSPGLRTKSFLRKIIQVLWHYVSTGCSLLRYLIPRRGRPIRLRELAHLDSIRGYMALTIYTMHVTDNTWRWMPEFVFQTPGLQFPTRGGNACVTMFFWISGYVVTYRPLGYIHAKEARKMLDTVSSTVFRRYLRLFLPGLPMTLFVIVGTHIGLVKPDDSQKGDGVIDMSNAYFLDSPYWWWVIDSLRQLNPFIDIRSYHNGGFGSRILPPLWYLCTEFRATMMLGVFLIATFRMPYSKRSKLILACIPICFYYEASWAGMALAGMWCADRRHRIQRETAQQPLPITSRTQHSEIELRPVSTPENPLIGIEAEKPLLSSNFTIPQQISTQQLINYSLFFYSWFILYDLNDTGRNNFFPNPLLQKIEPRWWDGFSQTSLHLNLGAVMLLYSLDNLPPIQKLLSNPFSQYLGELSFGIYVTHTVVRWIVWEPMFLQFFQSRGIDPAVPHRMIPGWIVMTIVVLWASEAFRKMDDQVARFCKWLEEQVFEQSENYFE